MEARAMHSSAGNVLLEARVGAGNGDRYAVSLSPVVSDDSLSPEDFIDQICFRFALHYYAHVLYELARTGTSAPKLLAVVERIAGTAVVRSSNLFQIAGTAGTLIPSFDENFHAIDLRFLPLGPRAFGVDGDFSSLRGALASSVLAVCQASLQHLSEANIRALPLALANMNVSYSLAHRFLEPASRHEVPASAYHATAFV